MPLSIKNAPGDHYFVCTILEDFDRDGAKEMAAAIAQHSQSSKIFKVLIDLKSARNLDSLSDKFFFAHEDAKTIQIEKTMQVALLVDPTDQSHDFIETVMRNNGYNVLKFTEEKKAIDWLIG